MDRFEKYLLLCSLSFFFGCLAVSLMLLHRPQPLSHIYGPPGASYIVPPQIITGGEVPNSILVYPGAEAIAGDNEVSCYLEAPYKQLIGAKTGTQNMRLTATAAMGDDRLEIYAAEGGAFSVFVIGVDGIGQMEACEVARGDNWAITPP